MHKPCAFEEAIFQTRRKLKHEINSQTLLGRSHHLLPMLKIFPASKAKPIYIANASIFLLPFLELKTAKTKGRGKKEGIFLLLAIWKHSLVN